ncbi:MAG: beta-ketoacyl-ACP synthase II [Rickettsiales bacterium]|nr:beta-ketoacyl-ACP synthase II [Rickettsiales bacterium]
MRRIVVTGLGLLTPLACGVEETWGALVEGRSGLRRIQGFDLTDIPAQVAGEIIRGTEKGQFNPDDYLEPKDQKKVDDFILYGITAAEQAIKDSGWKAETYEDQCMTGVLIGSGIGGLKKIEETCEIMRLRGPRRISPFFIPASLINLVSGQVSIKHGFKGPNHAVVTACSTGAHAIGDAAEMIRRGDANVMVAGGAEATVCRIGVAGFVALRALSTNFNDTPEQASRPWDKGRDGFVMGEGSGVVVLEEYEHAKKRGAHIYAELIGYGLSGDAYHITAPQEQGDGGFRSMQMAMRKAGLSTADVDYINAHGTSTPMGDEIEHGAVKRLFGADASRVAMSSTKSAIGHLLGAAGSVEAVFSILAIRDNVAPPTRNLDHPSDGCDMNLVPHTAQQRPINITLSNAFGFGGTNSTLIFRRV